MPQRGRGSRSSRVQRDNKGPPQPSTIVSMSQPLGAWQTVGAGAPQSKHSVRVRKLKREDPNKYRLLKNLFKLTVQFHKYETGRTSTVGDENAEQNGKDKTQATDMTSFLQAWMDQIENLKNVFVDADGEEASDDEGDGKGKDKDKKKAEQICQLQAYWDQVTPQNLASIVTSLGEQSGRFMRCLSVHINPDLRSQYPDLFDRLTNRTLQFSSTGLKYASGDFERITTEEDEDDSDEEYWDELAPKGGRPPPWWHFWQNHERIEVGIHWSGVDMLNTRSTVNMCALENVPYEAGVFQTPVGQALLARNWKMVRWQFHLDRAFDLACIVILLLVAGRSKEEKMPATWQVLLLLLINLYGIIFGVVIELIMRAIFIARELGPRSALPGLTTLLHISIQMFLAYYSWQLLSESGECMADQWEQGSITDAACNTSFQNSFLVKRPMVFSCMVLLTWIQFMVSIMPFETVGLTVLPALRAMLSKESMRFLIYMFLGVFMAFHAYYSLPLPNDGFETGGSLGVAWVSFLRMYRLSILGDFDFFELEGVDPTLSGSVAANGTIIGAQLDEDEKDYAKTLHRDVRLLACVLSFLLCVIMMNMYIGVLGHKYDDFKDRVNLVYAQSKCTYMTRYLMRRLFWLKLLGTSSGDHHDELDDHDHEHDHNDLVEDSDEGEGMLVGTTGRCTNQLHIRVAKHIQYCGPNKADMPDWYIDEGIPEWEKCSGMWIVVPDNNGSQEKEDPVDALADDVNDLAEDVYDLKQSMADVLQQLEAIAKHLKVPQSG